MYKVYTLFDPITNQIRYIGITKSSLIKRLKEHISDTKRENTKKSNWIKSVLRQKSYPIIEELDTALSLEKACALEIFYISLFKTWGIPLTNLTDGGEGFLRSKEQNIKHSNLLKLRYKNPENNPFYNKKHSEKTKEKISKANKGKRRTEEFKEKRRQIQKNWKPSVFTISKMIEIHGRRVVQLDKQLNFLCEFYTIKKAADLTNSLKEKISDCCKNKRLSHNKYVWMYKEDYEKLLPEKKSEVLQKLEKFKNYI